MNSSHDGRAVAAGVRCVLIAMALLSHPVAGLALSPQEVFAAAAASVAALEVLDDAGKPIGAYSATRVDARRFVSVCDVLDLAQAVRLSLKSGVFIGKVAARDRERNLCVIKVDGAPAQAIAVKRQAPPAGSRVFAVSNALGLGVGISEGVVSGVRHFPTGDYIQFTAPISPGSEGGALVDDDGQLLGIVDYRRRDGQNVNFASLAEWIDQIERRSAENAEELQRFEAATALLKRQEWAKLEALSADWRRRRPDQADAWQFSAAAARGLKHAAAELSAWKERYRLSPADVEVGIGLGQVLLANGDVKAALALGQQLAAAHQEHANVRWLLARAQQASGSLAEAEASYRQAIALDPWLLGAYQGLAMLAQARGDSATAISLWSRLAALYPDLSSLRLGLIQAYLDAGQAGRAYWALDSLPEAEKDIATAWYWRGIALLRLNCPDAAARAFRNSLDRQLDAADWAWAGVGFAMAQMKRFPEAIAAFESARKISPAYEDWQYQLAINLKDGGRAGEALAITTALIERSPGTARYWRQQGFVLAVSGRPLEAIPALERSLQLDANQAKVWGALIDAYQVAGRRKDAREAYQKLRTIDPQVAEQMYRSGILPFEGEAE